MEFTAELIAGFLQGDIVGDPKATVSELSKIEEGHPGSLAFLSNPKYEHYIYQTKATIVIVNRSFEPTAPVSATMIKVDDAYSCFAKLLELYIANKPQKLGISKLAAIHESVEMGEEMYVGDYAVIEQGVKIGNRCKIYPQVYLGDGVRLGDDVTLFPGVKIYEACEIGNRVTIHAGSIIGRWFRIRSRRTRRLSQDSSDRKRADRGRCGDRGEYLYRSGNDGLYGYP